MGDEHLERLRQLCTAFMRVHHGSVVFKSVVADFELSESLMRQAMTLASMAHIPRISAVGAVVDEYYLAVRFLREGAFIAVCDEDRNEQVNKTLHAIELRDLMRFGGGLSGHIRAPSFSDTERHIVTPRTGEHCSVEHAVIFLNEAFDFLFRQHQNGVRISRSQELIENIASIGLERGEFVPGGSSGELSLQECVSLHHEFTRIIEGLGFSQLQALRYSPISKPPWLLPIRLASTSKT